MGKFAREVRVDAGPRATVSEPRKVARGWLRKSFRRSPAENFASLANNSVRVFEQELRKGMTWFLRGISSATFPEFFVNIKLRIEFLISNKILNISNKILFRGVNCRAKRDFYLKMHYNRKRYTFLSHFYS